MRRDTPRKHRLRAAATALVAAGSLLGAVAAEAGAQVPPCPPEIPCPDPVDDLIALINGEDPDPDPEPEPEPEPPPEPPPPPPPPPREPDPPPPEPEPEPPPQQAPSEEPDAVAVVPRQGLTATRRGSSALRVTCAGRGVCRGGLRIEYRRSAQPAVLAAAPFQVAVGERERIGFRLTREARRMLRRRGRLSVVAVAITRPGEASERRTAARLTLRLRRGR